MTAGVVTGEAVVLDVRLAHWPSRLLARLIDFAAQFVLLIVGVLTLGRIAIDSDPALAVVIGIVLDVFIFIGYHVILETIWRGRTLGKAALGLRVVRDDGGPVRFRHALVRGLMFPLESWGPALVASIISKRSKRLGDMLAGTIVVLERVPGRTALPVQMPPPLVMWATTLDLSRFGDDLAMACRQFLGRQGELNAAARDAMGNQLVAAVLACVTPPPPPGTPGWAYLSAVLAERRRREELRLYASRLPVGPAQPGGWPQQGWQQSGWQQGSPPDHTTRPEPVSEPIANRPPGPFAPPQ